MAQLAPQPDTVLDFENQTFVELLSEDGLIIMARLAALNVCEFMNVSMLG